MATVTASAYKGSIKLISFPGPVSRVTVRANVYLPPDYANSSRAYPVYYHLHGKGGTLARKNEPLANALESAVKKGIIGPMICVFPDGYNNSMFADSKDGKKPAATNIVKELVPWIDSVYRTIGTRQSRAIGGFSMGGYGTAMLGSKHPELFCAGLIFDGALHTWSTISGKHPDIVAEMFSNSESYFKQFDPWTQAKQNAANLRKREFPFRIAQGSIGSNKSYHQYLRNLKISSEFVMSGCSHSFSCIIGKIGDDSFTFLARHLQQEGERTSPPPDSTKKATSMVHPAQPSESALSASPASSAFDINGRRIVRDGGPAGATAVVGRQGRGCLSRRLAGRR